MDFFTCPAGKGEITRLITKAKKGWVEGAGQPMPPRAGMGGHHVLLPEGREGKKKGRRSYPVFVHKCDPIFE